MDVRGARAPAPSKRACHIHMTLPRARRRESFSPPGRLFSYRPAGEEALDSCLAAAAGVAKVSLTLSELRFPTRGAGSEYSAVASRSSDLIHEKVSSTFRPRRSRSREGRGRPAAPGPGHFGFSRAKCSKFTCESATSTRQRCTHRLPHGRWVSLTPSELRSLTRGAGGEHNAVALS